MIAYFVLYSMAAGKFVNEQKIWVKLNEEFRINGREMTLYDSQSAMAMDDFNVAHNANRVTVENKLNVKIYADDQFNFTLWNHRQWVANIVVSSNTAKVNDIYRLMGTRIEMFHTTSVERKLNSNISLELRGEGVLHRVELRLPHSQWFSLFVFGRDVITVRTNGDFFAEKMQCLSRHVSMKTLEYRRGKSDFMFVVENNTAQNALVKCHASNEVGTQTEETANDEQTKINRADLKAAMHEVMKEYRLEAHPWSGYGGAASLEAQADVQENTTAVVKGKAKPEPAESRAETEWSYVYQFNPKPVDQKAVEVRRQNREMFGGLFDMKNSDDGDDEESRLE